ncbi:hypothetical protein VP01_1654g1 [Puccinia sorghi]|uniref:Uncharacterized protein n=1 Tax=Puccinia sorghi TaxID=27349 RepID=A0A0L6VGF9_9BASI|nr:hypothetical protein VP01_1654g1 [Puccinia sorghi]
MASLSQTCHYTGFGVGGHLFSFPNFLREGRAANVWLKSHRTARRGINFTVCILQDWSLWRLGSSLRPRQARDLSCFCVAFPVVSKGGNCDLRRKLGGNALQPLTKICAALLILYYQPPPPPPTTKAPLRFRVRKCCGTGVQCAGDRPDQIIYLPNSQGGQAQSHRYSLADPMPLNRLTNKHRPVHALLWDAVQRMRGLAPPSEVSSDRTSCTRNHDHAALLQPRQNKPMGPICSHHDTILPWLPALNLNLTIQYKAAAQMYARLKPCYDRLGTPSVASQIDHHSGGSWSCFRRRDRPRSETLALSWDRISVRPLHPRVHEENQFAYMGSQNETSGRSVGGVRKLLLGFKLHAPSRYPEGPVIWRAESTGNRRQHDYSLFRVVIILIFSLRIPHIHLVSHGHLSRKSRGKSAGDGRRASDQHTQGKKLGWIMDLIARAVWINSPTKGYITSYQLECVAIFGTALRSNLVTCIHAPHIRNSIDTRLTAKLHNPTSSVSLGSRSTRCLPW